MYLKAFEASLQRSSLRRLMLFLSAAEVKDLNALQLRASSTLRYDI